MRQRFNILIHPLRNGLPENIAATFAGSFVHDSFEFCTRLGCFFVLRHINFVTRHCWIEYFNAIDVRNIINIQSLQAVV